MTEKTRYLLRSLPSLVGSAPGLEVPDGPVEPVSFFEGWLDEARRAGVPEPQAMTVSTVDPTGLPDARVLVLKDVDERGWAFASTASSAKGAQLRTNPQAALTFWWQPVVRSVRVRGAVVEASREESLADLAARSPAARAGVDPQDWTLWRLEPTRVEFWQGSPDRRHVRIVVVRDDAHDPWRPAD